MSQPRKVEDCKRMLFKLAVKYAVPPKLISNRLLSAADKEDMLNGLITLNMLDCFIKTWKEYGMCNHTDGTGAWYGDFNRYAGVGWVIKDRGANQKFDP